jgi:adenylate cyclase class 2
MREIEIKARVADKAGLQAALERQRIVLSEPVTHRDRVFGQLNEEGGGDNTLPWLRIRTETKNGATTQIFTFKRAVTNQMDSIEHETEVINAEELEAIILQLGFTLYSDLTKTRQKARVGEIEICVDTVEGLGEFIEAEKLTPDDADYAAVAEELWVLLESLDVSRDDHMTDGYDVLMRKKQVV